MWRPGCGTSASAGTCPTYDDGVWHSYEPDFVARLRNRDGDTVHLIVECKGRPDDESETKARYVTDWWIPAVANSPQIPERLRRWSFVEITDAAMGHRVLADAIGRIITIALDQQPNDGEQADNGQEKEARAHRPLHPSTGAERTNIPTSETQALMPDDEQRPQTWTTRRRRGEPPTLSWDRRSKPDEFDAYPLYIREKVHPGAFVKSLQVRLP